MGNFLQMVTWIPWIHELSWVYQYIKWCFLFLKVQIQMYKCNHSVIKIFFFCYFLTGAPEAPSNVTVKQTSFQTILVSWLPGYDGGADSTFIVRYKISGSDVWTSSDKISGNLTSAMLNKEEGWNGVFVFSVLAVNQFGSGESSEVSVNLKGTLFNVYT